MIKNKKGLADDFGGLLVAGLLMVIIALAVLMYAGLQERKNQEEPNLFSNLELASQNTRIILEWELDSGMKVHEALIKHNQENNLDQFIIEIETLLKQQDLLPKYTWLIVIKTPTIDHIVKDTWDKPGFGDVSTYQERGIIRNSYLSLPRMIIPDGQGSNIEILIKIITKEDRALYDKLLRAYRVSLQQQGVIGVGPR